MYGSRPDSCKDILATDFCIISKLSTYYPLTPYFDGPPTDILLTTV